MRQVTIELEDDIFLFLELAAAKDDLRIGEGIAGLLTELCILNPKYKGEKPC